jgi:ABC-type multidrug transport system fused ATPase/permease subunit
MISFILPQTAGTLLTLIAFAAYVFIFALIIICLIRVSRYFMSAGKEQKLMRIELGKLAEEVHAIRQKLDNYTESKETADSQQS